MGFWTEFREGWKLFAYSFRVLLSKPVFWIPILFVWAIIIPVIWYVLFLPVPRDLNTLLLMALGLILLTTFVVCVANLMMLELVQQVESGEKTSLGKAVRETFSRDLLKVVPIALVWAVFWFVILVIKAVASGRRKKEAGINFLPRSVTLTQADTSSGLSLLMKLGLSLSEKLLRMYLFLSLPAIAWEDKGPISSFRKALEIIRLHPVQFLTAYTLTAVIYVLMLAPPAAIVFLEARGFMFSDIVWTGLFLYEAMVWTFGTYLEQMSVGLLYLWHLKWVKNGGIGDLSFTPKPDLLDNFYELKQPAEELDWF